MKIKSLTQIKRDEVTEKKNAKAQYKDDVRKNSPQWQDERNKHISTVLNSTDVFVSHHVKNFSLHKFGN